MKEASIAGLVRAAILTSLVWFPCSVRGGTVVAWGGNYVGQSTPCATNVVAIATGYEHSLLLKADGTVAACGAYSLPFTPPFSFPIIVPDGLTNVVAVSGGDSHSMALKADGTVVVWGINTDGQTNVPTGLTNVVAVSAGANHSLALKAEGTVVGWGKSGNVPEDLTNAVAISGGRGNSLVLKADGTVVGWGNFGFGDGRTNLASLRNIVAISAADNRYESWLALQANGVVIRQHANGGTTSWLSNVVAISASRGTDHHISLAVMADGRVVGWGFNFYADQGQPLVPPGLTNVVDMGGDDQHNLALIGDGPLVLRASLINPTCSTTGFSVAVPTQYERVYRLEYKNSLSDGEWIGLPLVAGNGRLRTLTDTAATGAQRFYRIRRW